MDKRIKRLTSLLMSVSFSLHNLSKSFLRLSLTLMLKVTLVSWIDFFGWEALSMQDLISDKKSWELITNTYSVITTTLLRKDTKDKKILIALKSYG
jgi:hypothetical protein